MRQISRTRRRLATGAFLIVAGPVALGSVAYACQSLATLHSNPRTATAGQTITVFGKNYSSNVASTPIEIRLDTRTGPVIASFPPASTINGPVTIPPTTTAGKHVLLATQTLSNGNPQSGTPGRATVEVTVAAAPRTSSVGSASPADAAAPEGAGVAGASATEVTPATPATPAAAAATTPVGASQRGTAPVGAPATAAAAATTAAAASQATGAPATASGPTTPGDPGSPAATATPALAAAAANPPAASTVDVGGLLPASSGSSSALPGLTLAAGAALVLLSLGAFLKSGRNLFGGSSIAS